MKEKLYFVDGYHGGVEGHMPDGSFEDILDALDRYPEWKVSFEIEPESWNELKRTDYPVYKKLTEFVASEENGNRIEFISGAYGQPFCWAINGESNVRQLKRGIEEIQKHFEGVVIDTYAVQEPCFTSSLPQICFKLGYRRMSLKNPTAWGGYMGKMKGSMISLCSADGSSLPAIPRYECEELVSCSATEAAGYDFLAIDGFAEKCMKHGIRHPLGMCLQDLGWKAGPIISNPNTEYVTYREYFERFADDMEGAEKLSQDKVCCALPWGNLTLQKMCRRVRALENRILQIEKLLSFAEMQTHLPMKAKVMLQEAWDMLLLAQHHDGYICATTPGSPYQNWASRADYLTTGGQKLLTQVENCVKDSLQTKNVTEGDVRYVRVYNTLGENRKEVATVNLTLPKGYQSVEVTAPDGESCTAQLFVKRRYEDDSLDAVKICFLAEVDGIGYRTYMIKSVKTPPINNKCLIKRTVQDTFEVENSDIFVVLDRTRGGSIVKLYEKKSGHEFLSDKNCMGYLKGYFVEEEAFVSTSEMLMEAEILENGPLYAKIRFFAEKKGVHFEAVDEFYENSPRIDVRSSVNFMDKTYIGYPLKPEIGEEFYGRNRSGYREDYKLGIQIPLPMNEFQIVKHAPYENYISENKDTRFLGWHEIKNNVINQFIDFQNLKEEYGLAVLCDHITGYSLVENQFALTQAFGYYGGFWWGCQPLLGKSEISYSIIPHGGNLIDGRIDSWNSRKNEPYIVQPLNAVPEEMEKTIFCMDSPGVETVTLNRENNRFYVRLFHHGLQEGELYYRTAIPDLCGEKADLNGEKIFGADKNKAMPSEIITLI